MYPPINTYAHFTRRPRKPPRGRGRRARSSGPRGRAAAPGGAPFLIWWDAEVGARIRGWAGAGAAGRQSDRGRAAVDEARAGLSGRPPTGLFFERRTVNGRRCRRRTGRRRPSACRPPRCGAGGPGRGNGGGAPRQRVRPRGLGRSGRGCLRPCSEPGTALAVSVGVIIPFMGPSHRAAPTRAGS